MLLLMGFIFIFQSDLLLKSCSVLRGQIWSFSGSNKNLSCCFFVACVVHFVACRFTSECRRTECTCNVGWDAWDLFSRLGKLLSSRLCQKMSFFSPSLCRAACFPRHEVSHSCTETLFASFLPEKCNSWPMTLIEVIKSLSHPMKSKIRSSMELWLNAFNYFCSCRLTGIEFFSTWKKTTTDICFALKMSHVVKVTRSH